MPPDNALHVQKAPDNASSVRILPGNALHVRNAPDNASSVRILPGDASAARVSPDNALRVRIPPANARLPSRAARALQRPAPGALQFHPAPRSLR